MNDLKAAGRSCLQSAISGRWRLAAFWQLVSLTSGRSDLGIDRQYERRGLGRRLVEAAHDLSGVDKAIVMFTSVNDDAIPFCEKLGLKPSADIYAKWKIYRTSFEVGKSGSE